MPNRMPTTPEHALSETRETAVAAVRETPNSAHELRDFVAKKVVDAIPENGPDATSDAVKSAESDENSKEGARLLAFFEALEKRGSKKLSEDEYRLLLDYGCVYAQGEHLKKRVADELAWFEAKKAILDDAAGFFGFMKRMNLEWSPIAHWFDVEYAQAFPDGTLAYMGYDHFQTTEVVNKRIALLGNPDFGNPDFGNPEWPLETIRAREWRKRLRNLADEIRNRRDSSEGNPDYSDLSDAGGIWLPASVIAAFAIAGMSTPAGEGGFSFWADTDDDGDSDGGSDGSGGGSGAD